MARKTAEIAAGTPARARLVGGVWLPETEAHFEEMMLRNPKRTRVVEGRHTYQFHKLEAALAQQPAERRRVALDIGAHVGLWAMWLVKHFDQLHAFEPLPWFADIFPHNVPMRTVELHRLALGRETGTVTLSVPLDMTGNTHVAIPGKEPDRRDGHGPVEQYLGVPMTTLDSFAFPVVDFIKIDVEGYELPVVEGARETIRRCRPNIVVEQKGNDQPYGEARNAALAYLTGLGMKPITVISGDHILGW
jgi:FkbM family methyltransferase